MAKENGNKTILMILIVAAFLVGAGGGFLGGYFLPKKGGSSGVINLYPSKASKVGAEWLVKIDDYAISALDFEEGFDIWYQQMAQAMAQQGQAMPDASMYKGLYLDELISQYVVVIQALEENIFNDSTNKLILNTSVRTLIYQVYLNKQMSSGLDFKPNDREINAAYLQHKDKFPPGTPTKQIRIYLEQQLSRQKQEIWMKTIVSQTKEQHIVKRNDELLNKLGITSLGNQGMMMQNGGVAPQIKP